MFDLNPHIVLILMPHLKSIVFTLCLLSLWGILCIQDCDSGCSDNYVGCTRARLYKRGNSGDMQAGVRGPSINLTGCRSCQEYERMLWSMLLSGRVSCCAHTATVPPSTTRASGPGRTGSLCPSPPSASGTTGKLCSARL